MHNPRNNINNLWAQLKLRWAWKSEKKNSEGLDFRENIDREPKKTMRGMCEGNFAVNETEKLKMQKFCELEELRVNIWW